jgi:pimeloyl-ACP methyl ester carboxylesterase
LPICSVAGGVDLFYTDTGAGPPVLLLHGWTCDGNDWAWLSADLCADHRVVNMDHRGHGRSSEVDGPYGAKPLAEDAARLLRHLGIEQAVVVGHSMGALVASVLAIEHPSLVRALVLIDPAYGHADDHLQELVAAVRAEPVGTAIAVFKTFYGSGSPAWLQEWHARRIAGTPPHVLAEALAALFEGPDAIGRAAVGADYLARRACPTLAIYAGPGDLTLPGGSADTIEVWPEAGHFLHQEQPDRFALRMRSWIASLGA